MSDEPFDTGLTCAQTERLAILAEEMGEAIQIIGKILRHGLDSDNNGELPQTNRQLLESEIGDVHAAIRRLVVMRDLDGAVIERAFIDRYRRKRSYTHFQEGDE